MSYTQSKPHSLPTDLSAATLQARWEWKNIFKVLKERKLYPKIVYPENLSFRMQGDIKNFLDKQKQREFITIKPAFQEMLDDIL